jgi:hypothetical protein
MVIFLVSLLCPQGQLKTERHPQKRMVPEFDLRRVRGFWGGVKRDGQEKPYEMSIGKVARGESCARIMQERQGFAACPAGFHGVSHKPWVQVSPARHRIATTL